MGKLHLKYPDDLVVIGVQSPKYTAEGSRDNAFHAVQRLGVEHPVVNDPDLVVWDAYAVNAWPTLVFISRDGRVLGSRAGEVSFAALDRVVADLLTGGNGCAAGSAPPPRIEVTPFQRPSEVLSFPGKVLAAADRIFIADSSHHRILVSDPAGIVEVIIGSGEPGFRDGDLETARFSQPQGMALDSTSKTLYVADAGNHAVRAIGLASGRLTTVAGTGQQALRAVRRGPARQTDLSSPWDLALDGQELFIAMAGTHQVWCLDLETEEVFVWAGTGHEALRDGPRGQSWLAQPMGLALSDSTLYVSCAEAQAVRAINLSSGVVTTLAGRGLFDFGDEDGPVTTALLQHNQAVAAEGNKVYIADTYNNKIKVHDRATATICTYAGSGVAGSLDGPKFNARFDEPSGLSLYGSTLYVADTNNHLIRFIDLDAGVVETLDLQGSGIAVRGR